MIKIISEKWEKNKDKLKRAFETTNGLNECEYTDIVKMTFDIIYNSDEKYSDETFYRNLDIENITKIDNGDYQGTLLYLIPFDTYQPNENEYLMTYVGYGSCSGCDTLLAIQADGEGRFLNDGQVNDFMTLALHILQHTIKPYNFGWRADEMFETIEDLDDEE